MAEISLYKRQRIRLYLLNYVIVLFLSNISCLQLCQMFYRGQLCELYFQILDHKQRRRPTPKFPIRFTPLQLCYVSHYHSGHSKEFLELNNASPFPLFIPSSSLCLPFHPSSPSLPSPRSLALEVGPVNPARESGGALFFAHSKDPEVQKYKAKLKS